MSVWDTFPLSIPGLAKDIEIQFPKQRLPVCVRCKHHYKTRKLCREKKKHSGLPWRKIYLCITLDDSCFSEDNALIKGPFVAKNTGWRPYQYKDSVSITSDVPMCAGCKSKNYTGSYCRERRNAHRDLPWDTVYVEFSIKEKKETAKDDENQATATDESNETDEKTKDDSKTDERVEETEEKESPNESLDNAGEAQPKSDVSGTDAPEKDKADDEVDDHAKKDDESSESHGTKRKISENDESSKKLKPSEEDKDNSEGGESSPATSEKTSHIFDVLDKSRTFCIEVSHHDYHAQWLDLDEDRAADIENEKNQVQCDNGKSRLGVTDRSFAQGMQMHGQAGAGYGYKDFPEAMQHNPYQYLPSTVPPPYYSYHPQYWSSSKYLPPPEVHRAGNGMATSLPQHCMAEISRSNGVEYHNSLHQQHWQPQPQASMAFDSYQMPYGETQSQQYPFVDPQRNVRNPGQPGEEEPYSFE